MNPKSFIAALTSRLIGRDTSRALVVSTDARGTVTYCNTTTNSPAAPPTMRLSWSVSRCFLEDWNHPIDSYQVIDSYRVVVETWDPELGPADDPEAWVELEGAKAGFDVDPNDPEAPDPQSSEPYTQAEDRLLAALGLDRDQITETVAPW